MRISAFDIETRYICMAKIDVHVFLDERSAPAKHNNSANGGDDIEVPLNDSTKV